MTGLHRKLVIFVLLGVLALVTRFVVNRNTSSRHQVSTLTTISTQSTARERKIGIEVPEHLPLKFEVKNLNSERWVHDLEIDVTNTSTKPIYYFDFVIIMPGYRNKTTGNQLGFSFRYGRVELGRFDTSLRQVDLPIAPGQKHTFKIADWLAQEWDEQSRKEGRPEPKLLSLQFQSLNFGDGTGFNTTTAEPVDINQKASPTPKTRIQPT